MCVHDLVTAQANATPDATAIIAGDRRLTYGDLNARANRLAHLLRSAAVGTEVPVGLCMRRSPESAIGALGILKAGGVYLPLDPSCPAHRLAMFLEDAQAPVLLTQPGVAEQFPAGKWRTIVLDDEGPVDSGYSSDSPITDTKPENLAYIIFTSGSTGRPKGVQITHANLRNLIDWHLDAFKVTSADRATMHASPGFDAAVWELWPYLAAGASVHVVDDSIRTSPEILRDWLVNHGITISFLPTALAEAVIDLAWPSETALRILLTGADTLRRRPRPGLPFTLINNYGPTECTVVATSGIVHPGADGLPAIGYPIAGTHVYIVDDQQKPVPCGRPGELLIGGAGVARGYVNRPELTVEKFIADPFCTKPGAHVYRTGDVGRFLPDGQIAFMGRVDDQIKIMGYRIEPAEITAALDRHSAIKASCVSTFSDGSNETRLIAYVVPANGTGPTRSELRKFLGDNLPDYMVPSTFVRLPQLPLSRNGKLDRAALPQPTASNTIEDDLFEAPQSPTEETLAGLMASLFGKRVGREDNFFTMGGHSLMGAQIITRIHDTFGVEVPLLSLFDRPTVRELSAEIERLIHAKLDSISEDEAQQLLSASPVEVRRFEVQ